MHTTLNMLVFQLPGHKRLSSSEFCSDSRLVKLRHYKGFTVLYGGNKLLVCDLTAVSGAIV